MTGVVGSQQVGERYILFLAPGQEVDGVATMRLLAPEGRYHIARGNTLKPVTGKRGFATQWPGRPVADMEAALAAVNP